MKRTAPFLLAISIAGALAVATSLASAAPTAEEVATAKTLFDEAKKLILADHWSEACPKLEESKKLDPKPLTIYRLADCHEHVGRVASAWLGFRDAAELAKVAGQATRAADAKARAAKLEPKVAKLSFGVEAGDAALVISLDGVEVPRARWGDELPVDPGDHVVEAKAPEKKAFTTKITATSEGGALRVLVPELASDAPPPPPAIEPPKKAPTPPPQPAPLPARPPDDRAPRGQTSPWFVLGLSVGSAGLAAMGVGTYLGFVARSRNQEADPYCVGARCDAAGKSINEDARRIGNAGTIAFVGGAVLTAAGIVLVLVSPGPKKPSRVHLSPAVASSGLGLEIGGAF